MNTARKFSLATIAALAMSSSWAAPDSATFGVSATIASECVVGNTSSMGFGRLDMLDTASGGRTGAPNVATAHFDATCTNGTAAPTLKFSSANSTEGFALKHGVTGETIAYSLHEGSTGAGRDISYDLGETFAGLDADGAVKTLEVTGKILAADKNGKSIGSYSDTVTITVGFTPDAN